MYCRVTGVKLGLSFAMFISDRSDSTLGSYIFELKSRPFMNRDSSSSESMFSPSWQHSSTEISKRWMYEVADLC